MAYENEDKLNDWVDDFFEKTKKNSNVKGVKFAYYQSLRGYFKHSIILTDIKSQEFGLVDYKIWEWILTNIRGGHNTTESGGIRLRYDKVSHLCKERAYYKSKALFLKLGLIIKTPFKDYYILNPKFVIKLYNPNDKDESDD